MSAHKNIDRICIAITAFALVIAFIFCNGQALGIKTTAHAIGYENSLFDRSKVHTIDIVMNDWEGFIEGCESEEYSACNLVIDGEAVKNVGIRAKGNTSLSSVKNMDSSRYSFKIEFDQYENGKTYHGLDKLCLNNIIQDNTYMKDYLAYTLMYDFGVDAPLCSYAYITVNGEDWGLYLAVEAIEESFLERNFGSNYGDLYKPDAMSFGGGRGNGKDFSMGNFMDKESGEDTESSDNSNDNNKQFTPPDFGGGMPDLGGEMPDFGDFDPENMPEDFDPSKMFGENGEKPDFAGGEGFPGGMSGDEMAVGTPDEGSTQGTGSGTDSRNYDSYDALLAAYETDVEAVAAGDAYGNSQVDLYNPLNYIGDADTEDPAWLRIVCGAVEGDISMFNSLNIQLAALDAGIDAAIEWQWDGGHVPGEVLGESLALWVDRMYGEYVDGAAAVEKAEAQPQAANGTAESPTGTDLSGWVSLDDAGNVCFTLADGMAYRTSGASKAVPGFDVIDYGQEDYVFGTADADARHWSEWVLRALEENREVLEPLYNQ